MRRLGHCGWMLVVSGCAFLIATTPPAPGAEDPDAPEGPKHTGRITGTVLSAATGKPIAGAYVGVGDFGDAGGSNLGRFQKQGLYAHTTTDAKGHFDLSGLALCDHPLVVTHRQFVRHDRLLDRDQLAVLGSGSDRPTANVEVRLQPAAEIRVTVLDATGKPVRQQLILRLEALDGHKFIPSGRQRHLSSFASSAWTERAAPGSFLFTELARGEYSLDVMQMTPKAVTYYGGIERVRAQTGETSDVQVKPADHQTRVELRVPEVPDDLPKEVPAMVVLNRNVGLLVWDDGLFHGPEDHRLGRIVLGALVYGPVSPGKAYQIDNLPPGTYSLFVGPVVAMKGVKVEVARGQQIHVEVPWVRPERVARVGLWRLDRRVQLQARQYTAKELCTLLTAAAKPGPEFQAHPSIRGQTLHFGAAKRSLWDVLERVYLKKRWTLVEEGEKTLILSPPRESPEPAAAREAAGDDGRLPPSALSHHQEAAHRQGTTSLIVPGSK